MLLERVRHRYLEFRRRFDQLMAEFREHCVALENDLNTAMVGYACCVTSLPPSPLHKLFWRGHALLTCYWLRVAVNRGCTNRTVC